MSKREAGMKPASFYKRQKYIFLIHLRRQAAAPSEGTGRTSRGTVHPDTVKNAVVMVDRNIICLFPVKVLKLTAQSGSFSMR